MKKWQKILIITGIVVVGLLIVKNQVIKTTITTVGSNVVGAPLKIKKFSLGLFTQKVRIKGFQVYNPKGFPREPFIDISEVSVDYDLPALIKGKLHLPLIVFDLKEMVVIKNKDGNLNVDSLKIAQEEARPAAKQVKEQPQKKSQPMPFQIDVMKLNIGRVVYKDYSKGEQPTILVYDVGLKDKTFKNITSVQQMAAMIMVQTMGPTAIKSAKMYAAATILGVGFLPAGVAGVLMGSDSSSAEVNAAYDKTYGVSLNLIKGIGKLKSEDKSKGIIKAKVDGVDVTVRIAEKSKRKVELTVSARKMMLPKPEFAGGVLYRISEKLK